MWRPAASRLEVILMQRILDSLWGTVSHCWQIAPAVFMVDTIRPDADTVHCGRWQQGGIMILADVALEILPDRAVLFGEYGTHPVCEVELFGSQGHCTEHEFLEFGNDGSQLIPLYELLASRYITDYEVIRSYNEYELINDGRYQLPEYFGELIFPLQLFLRCEEHRRLDNGIWAVRCHNGNGICVHNTVAEIAMSDAALMFATAIGNSRFFWESSGAIALLELADSFSSVDSLVREADRASMRQVVSTQYPLYKAMNDRRMTLE